MGFQFRIDVIGNAVPEILYSNQGNGIAGVYLNQSYELYRN